MSELGAGRASNGGARTGGPVPVSTGTPTGMKTPRDVMRERNAREARRQEEQKAEEQRRVAEERRRSAERRAAAVSGGAPRFSQASSQYTPDVQQGQFDSRGSTRVAGSDAYGDPTGRTSQNYDAPAPRPRGPSVPQQEQPRAAPTTTSTGGARRTQQSQNQPAPRQPASSSTSAGAQQQQQPFQSDAGPSRQSGAASFPHAFERWETLSSHWEGLTSYWIRRLEQNTEEMKDSVPNSATLNRQITDLSAAGANLFHAVVELQRLRASSERKFQRWFFETRAETEKNRETSSQVENQLKLERSAREDAARQRVEATIQAENARRETAEMKRELAIAKDEARRAWEELGRRNQESLETAQNLKDGRITLVGGVQVVPYFGGPSRSGTGGSQRPVTRDGQPVQYSSTGMASAAGAAGLQSPGDDERYYRQEQEASPTNTDPFMESGTVPQPLHHEPGKQSLAAGTYQPAYGDTPATASTAQTAIPLPSQMPSASSPGQSRTPRATDNIPISATEAQRFYQQPPQQTFLHSPPGSSGGAGTSQGMAANREDIRSDESYVGTSSENDTEYALDSNGNIRYDEQGRPLITYRRRGNGNGNGNGGGTHYGSVPEINEPSEDEDDYDADAIRREQELSERYGGGGSGSVGGRGGGGDEGLPEAPTVPSTSAQAMATYQPTTSGGGQSGQGQGQGRPDYSGQDYGPWEAIQTRHHHPTRLSDVLEEEEERSSRRTGPE